MKKKFLILFLILVSLNIKNDVIFAASANKDKGACDITVSKDGTYGSVGQVYTSYVKKGGTSQDVTTKTEIKKTLDCNIMRGKCSAPYYCQKNGTNVKADKCGSTKLDVCTCTYLTGMRTVITPDKTVSGQKDVKGNQYSVDGDPTYCLQPGKRFSSSAKYKESGSFDISDCKKSNQSYECGLAYILLTTKDGGDYGTTLTALRIWASLKGQSTNNFGNEDEDSSVNDFIATDSFYSITGKAMSGGNYNPGCTPNRENQGLICGGSMQSVYQLVKDTLAGEEVKIEGSGSEPVVKSKTLGPETEVGYTSSSFTEEFTREHVVKIKITPDGKEEIITSSENGDVTCGAGGKNQCIIVERKWKEIIKKICEQLDTKSTTKATIQIEITNFNPTGQIAMLDPCGGDYQKMIVIRTDEETENENSEEPYESEETDTNIVCEEECSEEDECPAEEMVMKITYPSCDDFTATSANSATHGITNGSKIDPYMNCILNTCATELKELYNQTDELLSGSNKTCKIYCRETVNLWLPTKTTVYAGMQFRYKMNDYASQITTVSGESKAKPMETEQNLTSIVMTEVQCTSEIYYDKPNPDTKESWLQRYTQANQDMIAAWKQFKYYEAMYIWQKKTGNKYIDENSSKFNGSQYETYTVPCVGECGGSYEACRTKDPYKSANDQSFKIYHWGSQNYKVNTELNGNINNKMKLDDMNKILDATKQTSGSPTTLDDGTISKSGTCSPGQCAEKTMSVVNEDGSVVEGHCEGGSSGSITNGADAVKGYGPTLAKDNAEKYRDEYIKQAKLIETMIMELNECNLYENSHIMDGVTRTIEVKSDASDLSKSESVEILADPAMNKILNIFNQEDGDISEIELDVEYADQYYGKTPQIEKKEAALSKCSCANNVKYCVDSKDKEDCYEYIPNTEKEISGSDSKKNHKHLKCQGSLDKAECKKEEKSLPENDYATFKVAAEADFWNAATFRSTVYTGDVVTGSEDSGDKTTTSLGKNVYPIKLNTYSTDVSSADKTWIKFHFTNVGFFEHSKLPEYDYECSYKVINSTILYDCVNYYDERGNIKQVCPDDCLNVDETVTTVCPEWEIEEDRKTNGFIYRNVELGQLFPNSESRVTGTNWTGEENEDLIEYLQTNAEGIYNTTPEYSFTLTTDAINNIREYNDERKSISENGGYLDESLSGCDITTEESGVGGSFKNCKSSFLNSIATDDNDYGIIVNQFRNFEGRRVQ